MCLCSSAKENVNTHVTPWIATTSLDSIRVKAHSESHKLFRSIFFSISAARVDFSLLPSVPFVLRESSPAAVVAVPRSTSIHRYTKSEHQPAPQRPCPHRRFFAHEESEPAVACNTTSPHRLQHFSPAVFSRFSPLPAVSPPFALAQVVVLLLYRRFFIVSPCPMPFGTSTCSAPSCPQHSPMTIVVSSSASELPSPWTPVSQRSASAFVRRPSPTATPTNDNNLLFAIRHNLINATRHKFSAGPLVAVQQQPFPLAAQLRVRSPPPLLPSAVAAFSPPTSPWTFRAYDNK